MNESTLIEKLQDLCAEHGCPHGINRFEWLDYMLKKLDRLEAERDALKNGAEKTVKAISILHDGPDDSDVDMAEGMLTEAIGIFRAAIAAKEPK